MGPFEVLERIGTVAYCLALLPSLAHIHGVFHVSALRPYFLDLSHILDWNALQVEDMQLTLEPMAVL